MTSQAHTIPADEYVPIGILPESGEFSGGAPNEPAALKERRWKSSDYTYRGRLNGTGKVRRIVPKVCPEGERGSYYEAPRGAPIFDYDTADAIRRAVLVDGQRWIDALCRFHDTDKLSPAWLAENGADFELIDKLKAERAAAAKPVKKTRRKKADAAEEAEATAESLAGLE